MSNKMLLALFVVGAVVVGGVALRNKTNETTPVVTTEVETVVDDANCPAPESTVEAVVTDVVAVEIEAPTEEVVQ
jgi:outer membrane murein-binding lipoprotein Lpp